MTRQRKALLVGSSFSAAPIFFALKKYGLHVSVCGKIESDPCHQYADASFYIDYSKPEELREVLDANEFDFLVPTCNDYSYMACAALAKERGFCGIDTLETASILHQKNKFRLAVEQLGLPAPAYRLLQRDGASRVDELRFPVLVKPIDSFSGRGMTKVFDPASLPQAIEDAFGASRGGGGVVVEEFVEGALHSHSAFIQNGRVCIDFFVDEFCTVYPYQVDCSNHPSGLNEGVRANVRAAIDKLASALKIVDGLLHTQFIANGNDFWIIETMRRCPGDLYGSLIEFSTGAEYSDFFVRPYLGLPLPETFVGGESRFYGRHTISVAKPLINFSFSQSLPSDRVDIVSLKSSGERLGIAPFDKLAILFAEFRDAQTMFQVTPRMAEHIRVREHGEQ